MKIMIATPAYGGEVTTTYCDALIWLLDHFREKHQHIRFQHKFLSLSVLSFMRNLYASLVMQDESYTHLLFVDADMGFAPSLIEHMIAADKPVVGSMAPHRKLDLAKFYALRDQIADPTMSMPVRSTLPAPTRHRAAAARPRTWWSTAPVSACARPAPECC
jgi:hypothetical protein